MRHDSACLTSPARPLAQPPPCWGCGHVYTQTVYACHASGAKATSSSSRLLALRPMHVCHHVSTCCLDLRMTLRIELHPIQLAFVSLHVVLAWPAPTSTVSASAQRPYSTPSLRLTPPHGNGAPGSPNRDKGQLGITLAETCLQMGWSQRQAPQRLGSTAGVWDVAHCSE
jgi:hypothetical protein